MYQIRLINLKPRLHDGGDLGVGGISTPAANDSQPTDIATEPVVVYGKLDTDPVAQGTPEAPAETQPQADDRPSKYSQFKDEYKDLYENDFKQALDRRMKGRDKEVGKLKGLLDPLMQHFGYQDITELEAFVKDYIIPNTEGYTARDIQLMLDGEEGDGGAKAAPEAKAPAADLDEQAAALAEKLAAQGVEFDLEAETANETVKAFLDKGLSLEQSYNLAHHDEIVARTAELQRKATIEAIRSKGIDKVSENIAKPAPAIIHKADPSSFSDEDIKEIARRVARGEQIRF
jgi:hypothetical protein